MEINKLQQQIVDRVANCYVEHRLCCSESIMVVLNRVFGGGLSDRTAQQMAAGFCHGIGGAGCSCGALTGSVTMLSLFLGQHYETGLSKKKFRRIVKGMHDDFRDQFGSSCCRVLSKKVKHDRKAHYANCLMLTKGSTEMAVTLLLGLRPNLLDSVDRLFLESREYPIGVHSPSST